MNSFLAKHWSTKVSLPSSREDYAEWLSSLRSLVLLRLFTSWASPSVWWESKRTKGLGQRFSDKEWMNRRRCACLGISFFGLMMMMAFYMNSANVLCLILIDAFMIPLSIFVSLPQEFSPLCFVDALQHLFLRWAILFIIDVNEMHDTLSNPFSPLSFHLLVRSRHKLCTTFILRRVMQRLMTFDY